MRRVSEERRSEPWKLWFGLLGGAIAWTLHLLIGYFLLEAVCTVDILDTYEVLDWPNWVILAITLLFAGIAAAAGVVAYRSWQQLQEEEGEYLDRTQERQKFMAIIGTLLSGLFFVATLLEGLPALFLRACQ